MRRGRVVSPRDPPPRSLLPKFFSFFRFRSPPDRVSPIRWANAQMSPSTSGPRDLDGLYGEYGILVYVIAMRTLRDHQLAEDAAQEAWIRISRQLDKGFKPDFEQSWVVTIARREAMRIAGRRREVLPLATEEPCASDRWPQADLEEERERLRSAIERLPEEDREVIRLSYLEELPPASLRQRLGIAYRSNVSRRLRRAMDRLRRLLGGTE